MKAKAYVFMFILALISCNNSKNINEVNRPDIDIQTQNSIDVSVIKNYCTTGSGGTDIHQRNQKLHEEVIFQGGDDEGYHSYRIPAIIKTNAGTLIAFCEGRKKSRHDFGDIDIVYRRSTDNGLNWGPLNLLFSKHGGTCGNPTPVVDEETGAIWIFMSYNDEFHAQKELPGYEAIDNWGERKVYYNVSYDDGLTWNDLKNRTSELLPESYTWDAIGPGNGIQLRHGNKKGRLIIPAIGRNIISDNHGSTWTYQLITPGTSEGTIVQLCNGDILRNDRASLGLLKEKKRRQISTSSDNGLNWSDWQSNAVLLDPICQASIIRYNDSYPPRLIFINPATTIGGLPNRNKMRVRISYDDGTTWPVQRLLDADNGGYSSLAKTADYQIASLQELRSSNNNVYSIIFRKFNLPWILNGTPEPLI